MKTPWAKIAENPKEFFDSECFPEGFKFEDPSRMGKQVKKLINHLRERQKTMGVNAFRFEHTWKDKSFHPAQYPEIAKQAIDAGDEVLNWEIPTDASVAEAAEINNITTDEGNIPVEESSTIPTESASSAPPEPPLPVHKEPTPGRQCIPATDQTEAETFDFHVTDSDIPPVPDSTDWDNIDPRLHPHADILPSGDPFPHLKIPTAVSPCSSVTPEPGIAQIPTWKRPAVQWSPLPPKIIPPNFSASSTPARTPRKRKRSELDSAETPTTVRPKRQIVTPKRYIENAST